MKFIRRKKVFLAFVLVFALLLGHMAGIGPAGGRREVMAAPEEPVVDVIPTGGIALTVDETMAVENFAMSANTVNSITLSWEYHGTVEAEFYLFEYSEETGTYRPFAATAKQSYTLTGLDVMEQRYFIVCPYNITLEVQGKYSDVIEACIKPKKVQGLTLSEVTSTGITLSWQAIEGVTGYEIYRAKGDEAFEFVTRVAQENVPEKDSEGVQENVPEITPENVPENVQENTQENVSENVQDNTQKDVQENVPENTPENVQENTQKDVQENVPENTPENVQENTQKDVQENVPENTPGNVSENTQARMVSYRDEGLETARGYRYKVRAYVFAESNCGAFSAVSKTCTLPSVPVVTVKGGDTKIRISWKAVTRAKGYRLYIYQEESEESYQLLETLEGKSNKVYLHKDLPNGEEYSYAVEAYREYSGAEISSGYSGVLTVSAKKPAATSTKAKLYQSKKKLKASDAFKECVTMKQLDYEKSFNLPGLVNTNVDGFNSVSMCPQGITFAGSYILLTAYDLASEENSVIYVLKKSDRKLMATIVLPGKPHAGGIAYDGVNVWITQSNTVHSIPFTEVKKAVAAKQAYYLLTAYQTTVELNRNAGSLSYYKNKLWIAEYNELQQGSMGAYTINSKTNKPDLTEVASVSIPTKVQGITFVSGGRLIFSRSCQTDPKQRGYSHMLDTYKPDLSGLANGKIKLGKCKKSVDMPSMNEEIAVNGNFVYVTFESGAFAKAIKRMDRVCAFKIGNIVE